MIKKDVCPVIMIDEVKCYSFPYAQYIYTNAMKNDKNEIRFKYYSNRSDVKPLFDFIIKNPDEKNLYLMIIKMINDNIRRGLIMWIDEDDGLDTYNELELKRKHLIDIEDWYVTFVLESVEDLVLNNMICDPYQNMDSDYISDVEFKTMVHQLSLLDCNFDITNDYDTERKELSNYDADYLADMYCKTMHCNIHKKQALDCIERFSGDDVISKRIIRNAKAYKNIRKAKGNTKNRSKTRGRRI